jgi:20S proteasome alpha/beta subunit
MTIAAGFHFADGLLLCADTQITQASYMKLHNSKIVAIDFASNGGSKAIFALTGSVPYCHMAIEHCRRELASNPPNKMSSSEMMISIEEALEGFCQDHLYKHPGFERGEISVQMLIGTWSHADNMLTLLATRENAVNVVRDYECLGAGQFLAHYLIPTLFRHSSMALDDATNVAFHVLKETKEYVDSCGGGSQVIVLNKDGKFKHAGYAALRRGESMSEAFKEAIRRLLVCSADLNATEEQLKKEFDMALLIINSSREQLRRENQTGLSETFIKLDEANLERWIVRS